MKKTNLLFWTVLLLLATACGTTPPPEVSVLPEQLQVNCSFSVSIIGEKTVLLPNETTRLATDQVGFGWQYAWSSPGNHLSVTDASSTLFTAPATEGSVTITVEVTDDKNCKREASIKIEVVSQLTPAATDIVTDVATAVSTETASPTTSPTATQTVTLTPTAEPSSTPSPTFTSTPAYTPLPSHTSLPTMPAFQILLKEPKNETCVGADNAVFEWLATRPLNTIEGANGEYFALNIWAADTAVYSVSWIKEPRYEIQNISDPIAAYTQQINCNGANGCFWNVDLIVSHVDRGSGWLPDSFTKIASSPIRNFCTHLDPAPIPPTNTPEPPPVPTAVSCPPDC